MNKRLEERINTYGTYLKQQYGTRTFRVGLSTGIACPHRENNDGCIFCLPETYTDQIQSDSNNPESQLDLLIPKVKKGCGDVGILAYFQHDTSTAGDLQELKQIFDNTLKHSEIKGLIISTRPDFLNEEIMEMLKDLQGDIFLEIGLQSIHQSSLDLLNRGHSMRDFERAIKLCENYEIETGVHVILGIPGESLDDMLSTIRYINNKDIITQIKFHNLVVYKDTKLASFPQEVINTIPKLNEYITLLGTLLQHTKGDKVISRLFTSNVNRSNLALNPFPGIKRQWLNKLNAYLNENSIVQGIATDRPFISFASDEKQKIALN
ncbi:MAG: TIGR01212 family radical SAM protein [Candidatus Cloacimonetes bacterium]|nr:TIGR01212 family radical SAM protein [Candidatus Cloacimonadota bacterium]